MQIRNFQRFLPGPFSTFDFAAGAAIVAGPFFLSPMAEEPFEAAAIAAHRQQSTLASLIAGSAGGATQVLVGQPLDTIKTRAQIAPPGLFKGPTDIAVQTVRKEGFLALYKGAKEDGKDNPGRNFLLKKAYIQRNG
jgi:hypothetical protein